MRTLFSNPPRVACVLAMVLFALFTRALAQDNEQPEAGSVVVASDPTAVQYIVALPREEAIKFLSENATVFLADRSAWVDYSFGPINLTSRGVAERARSVSTLPLRPFFTSQFIVARELRDMFPNLPDPPATLSEFQREALRFRLGSPDAWSDHGPLQFFYTPEAGPEGFEGLLETEEFIDRMKRRFDIIIHPSPRYEALLDPDEMEQGVEALDVPRVLERLLENRSLFWVSRFETKIDEVPCENPPNDPEWVHMTHLRRYNLCDVWDRPVVNPHEVLVGVIDSGVRLTHEDLAGKIRHPIDVFIDDQHGDVYADGDPNSDDHHRHGTRTAGVIAATIDNCKGLTGFAPVSIIPVNTTRYSKTGKPSGDYDHWVDGMYWAMEHGADVICLNLRGVFLTPENYYYAEEAVASYSVERDVVVCAAAGNGNPSDIEYPEASTALNSYLCVTGADVFGSRRSGCNYGERIDIGAFAYPLFTTDAKSDDAYLQAFTATSAATPQVAGLCALLKYHYGDKLSAADIRMLIKANTRNAPSPSISALPTKAVKGLGHGLIDPPKVFDAAEQLLASREEQ